jgi:hypothetical protein
MNNKDQVDQSPVLRIPKRQEFHRSDLLLLCPATAADLSECVQIGLPVTASKATTSLDFGFQRTTSPLVMFCVPSYICSPVSASPLPWLARHEAQSSAQ